MAVHIALPFSHTHALDGESSWRSAFGRLRSGTRLQLRAIVLGCSAVLVLLFLYWSTSPAGHVVDRAASDGHGIGGIGGVQGTKGANAVVGKDYSDNIYAPPAPPDAVAGLSHLVVVAGHAIWLGGLSTPLDTLADERGWILEDAQKHGVAGDTLSYIAHIEAGLHIAKTDKHALLVLSGGQTREKASGRTEGGSYRLLLDRILDAGVLAAGSATQRKSSTSSTSTSSTSTSSTSTDGESAGASISEAERSELESRITTEVFARDSYENLIFSIARFREYTGVYPRRVTVVGFAFKQRRFTELHRQAIGLPAEAFEYVGVDHPPWLGGATDSASSGASGDAKGGVGGGSDRNTGSRIAGAAAAGGEKVTANSRERLSNHGATKEGVSIHATSSAGRFGTPYLGWVPPSAAQLDALATERAAGELKYAAARFWQDPYGCTDPTLGGKRLARNPARRRHGYELSCPELSGLLRWCPAVAPSVVAGGAGGTMGAVVGAAGSIGASAGSGAGSGTGAGVAAAGESGKEQLKPTDIKLYPGALPWRGVLKPAELARLQKSWVALASSFSPPPSR